MRKIFNADILDIFVTDTGFIYSCEEKNETGDRVAAFYSYNISQDVFDKIPVGRYIREKFGENGDFIARSLGDFITCRVTRLNDTLSLASYKNGLNKYFDQYGVTDSKIEVRYEGHPASAPIAVGRNLWYAVPDANTIINYSLKYERIEVRIGSIDQKAFYRPTDLQLFDNLIYVCNANSYKIRTVDIDSFNVTDYYIFREPVYGYFRTCGNEYAILQSGVYQLNAGGNNR